MVLIPVPKPPKSAMNPGRPVSTLLKNQMLHLQEAEFRLPVKMQTNIYINSIKTEGKATDYIRRVTEALHEAHGVEPSGHAARMAVVAKRTSVRGPDIAAVAEKTKRKSKNAGKKAAVKKKSSKRSSKK